ncbi:SDR family NAD(P)-dependent oxidoreductase [Chitinophaga silvatica]|uniref:SDR family NAD(P)-dependent oxidoreductase n=1 Tax=Chitinophaga silvatica TaxID=2282649 RepID=A0A3E1Y5T9_9BACT|nr:SDR family oxidoreductase [Chitinophaga silvatica]RFS20104.1 SDR family NAD(P)-dependent oxidoreductase [Chitinophaga silvatica]
MTQTKILLSGATGNVGTQLVKRLAAMNIPFRALVRNAENIDLLKSLPQAEVIIGDMADESTLLPALKGIEKAFLLTNSSEHAEKLQLNFVNAAKQAGVKHLIKLSQFAADENSPVRFLRYHARVENRIKDSGLNYTFLRPNLYMQGLLAFSDYIKNDGKFYAAVGTAAISAVDVRDIAAVACKVLTEDGHENKIYNITGKEAITHYQMADALAKVLGREISFIDVSPEQMEGALRAAGFPEWQVGGLLEDYAHYARGEAATIYNTVNDVTNNTPASFEKFVTDYKVLFN